MARGKRTARQINKARSRGWAALIIGIAAFALGVWLCAGSYTSSEVQFDVGFVLVAIGVISAGGGAIALTVNSSSPSGNGNGNSRPRTS